jgi:predicted ABC-type ATPase
MKVAVFICGSAGTGKTTTKNSLLKFAGIKSKDLVLLNIDDARIQDNISQEEARIKFEKLIRETIDHEKSFIYDGTCRNRKSTTALIKEAKQKKYRVVLGITYTTLDTALARVAARHDQPLTPDIIRDIYADFSKKAEGYFKNENVDDVYLFNNENTSALIYYRKHSEIHYLHPEYDFYFKIK